MSGPGESMQRTDPEALARLRTEYADTGLDESAAGDDPYPLLESWLAQAVSSGMHEPNAMTLSTLGLGGAPSARLVLLKGLDARALVFFTNYRSRKSRELDTNPYCALVLPWHPLQRQVRVEGIATKVSAQESDAYFASRPRGAQLGAWASPQSQVITGRAELDAIVDEVAARFPEGSPVPRPPHWGGWQVAPHLVEFWQGRPSRLHDRVRFTRAVDGPDNGRWTRDRLAP